ncbi:MAG TPA: hypothetical protein VF403_21675 [Kofleriaceae bacterium]
MRPLLFAVIALAGCAEAGKQQLSGHGDGGVIHVTDSSIVVPDAFVSHIDAPPGEQTKTLDENSSDTIKLATSIACSNNTTGFTLANSYYRVFDPATFGITTDFHVTQIGFQVEDCSSTAGGQVVTAKVGTYNGTPGATITTGNMAVLATNSQVQVPEIDLVGGSVNAPITATIPAGKKVFVEIDSPDGTAGTNASFFLGVNTAAETGFGYILATGCSISTPTNVSSAGVANTQISFLMTVTGTY